MLRIQAGEGEAFREAIQFLDAWGVEPEVRDDGLYFEPPDDYEGFMWAMCETGRATCMACRGADRLSVCRFTDGELGVFCDPCANNMRKWARRQRSKR